MKLNIPAFTVLIILPLILVFGYSQYNSIYNVGLFEIFLVVFGYYVSNITVGIGLHRLWSHNSYKTHYIVEFILCLLSAGTLQGPVLAWASDHFKHHTYTDTDKDPHSPLKYKNKLIGFLWSHMGWMLFKKTSYKSIDSLTLKKLGKNKLLRWQLKHYWKLAILMNLIVPFIFGYLIGNNIQYAIAGILFIGIGRAIQQQMTFCINSYAHFFGEQTYYSGTARDSWLISILLLGENWHNFHHAFPQDYRNGIKWYHFDVHKWIIFLMSKTGLAWDLNVTSDARINAKKLATFNSLMKQTKFQWLEISTKTENLIGFLQNKIENIETVQKIAVRKLEDKYKYFQENLRLILKEAKIFTELPEKSSQKLLTQVKNRLIEIENKINFQVKA